MPDVDVLFVDELPAPGVDDDDDVDDAGDEDDCDVGCVPVGVLTVGFDGECNDVLSGGEDRPGVDVVRSCGDAMPFVVAAVVESANLHDADDRLVTVVLLLFRMGLTAPGDGTPCKGCKCDANL